MKTFLADLAEEAPVARASVDVMWHLGRRRRRTRMLTVAATVTALAAALAPLALPSTAPRPQPADGERTALPRSVGTPYFWHRTLGEAPNGPALAVLEPMRKVMANVSSNPLDLPGQLARTGATVVIGRDGSYRLIHGSLAAAALSPDGRYLAESASVEEGIAPMARLIDLTAGTERRFPGETVLAWWPDSSRLLVRDYRGALVSIDIDTLAERTVAPPSGTAALPAGIVSAAVSPDGKHIAYEVDPQPGTSGSHALMVSDSRGLTEARLELTDQRSLAGPAAWAPDGHSVALLDVSFDDEEGSVLRWDVATADSRVTSLGSVHGKLPQQVVGWRGDRPVLTVGNRRTDHVSVSLLRADGTLETLMVTNGGVLYLPQQLVNRDEPSGPALAPPTFEPAAWASWTMGVIALIIAALATRLSRRRRRRRESRIH